MHIIISLYERIHTVAAVYSKIEKYHIHTRAHAHEYRTPAQ